MTKEVKQLQCNWEQEETPSGFQVKGRKFTLTNHLGDSIELSIGETFWLMDETTQREGQNVFFLHCKHNEEDPNEWDPTLCVYLDVPEEVKDYAENHCWGRLNADEQREMDQCPVVAYHAVQCPKCKDY
jgi:hypothetical protein